MEEAIVEKLEDKNETIVENEAGAESTTIVQNKETAEE